MKASVRAAHRARLSGVVTAALLSEVAEVVALPDLRSEVPEDRVSNRDVEEEVGQNQVTDVVVAAIPPTHDRRRQYVCVGLRAGKLVRLHVLRRAAVRRHGAEVSGRKADQPVRASACGRRRRQLQPLPAEVGRGRFASLRNAGREGRRVCSRVCPRPTAGLSKVARSSDPLRCLEPDAISACTFGSATLTTELSMNPSTDAGNTQRGSRPAGRTADGVSQGAFWKPTNPVLLAPARPSPRSPRLRRHGAGWRALPART
jgi:hypothetical protein